MLYTMFPGSVDALAKMKIAFGQEALLPLSSSVRVLDWRASRVWASASASGSGAGAAMGEAIARPAMRVRIAKDFMLEMVTELN